MKANEFHLLLANLGYDPISAAFSGVNLVIRVL